MSLTFKAVIKWHPFTVSRLKAKTHETQSCEKFKQRCEPLRLEAMNILFTCTKVVLWATVYSVYRMWNIAVTYTIHTICLSTIQSKYVHNLKAENQHQIMMPCAGMLLNSIYVCKWRGCCLCFCVCLHARSIKNKGIFGRRYLLSHVRFTGGPVQHKYTYPLWTSASIINRTFLICIQVKLR